MDQEWRTLRKNDGFHTRSVFLHGKTIHKESSVWTSTVHALLEHLARHDFPAPRVVDSGFDDLGRETITFIDGEIIELGPWPKDNAYRIGLLLRQLHNATADFTPPENAIWYPWFGRDIGDENKVIGHCDIGPWNIVTRNGKPIALIDFDFAGPVDPVVELAQACWLNAKLYDDIVAKREGLPGVKERARGLRAIVDGYGLESAKRKDFIKLIIEVAINGAAAEADLANILFETEPRDLARQVPWAIAWRTRSAAWIIRNREILEKALR